MSVPQGYHAANAILGGAAPGAPPPAPPPQSSTTWSSSPRDHSTTLGATTSTYLHTSLPMPGNLPIPGIVGTTRGAGGRVPLGASQTLNSTGATTSSNLHHTLPRPGNVNLPFPTRYTGSLSLDDTTDLHRTLETPSDNVNMPFLGRLRKREVITPRPITPTIV